MGEYVPEFMVRSADNGFFPNEKPQRTIYESVDLAPLPPGIRLFYQEDESRSGLFLSGKQARDAYFLREPAMVIIIRCIDEREGDTGPALGLPLGTGNFLPLAGCQIGGVNLPVRAYLQRKINKAHKHGKVVILLVVTHESGKHPTTDSCAAWNHDIVSADAYATRLVDRFNRDYVVRDAESNIVRRHLIAFHVKSFTDTESRVWMGSAGARLDPSSSLDRSQDGRWSYRGELSTVNQAITEGLYKLYPANDGRFIGLHAQQYHSIIAQIARMATCNAVYMCETGPTVNGEAKLGHQGKRILVGRGWEMYSEPNEYFLVSDYSPRLMEEIDIAMNFVLRNAIVALRNNPAIGALPIPIHVNVLYDEDCPADRSGSIAHALDLGCAIKEHLIQRCTDRSTKHALRMKLKGSLKSLGIAWSELPRFICDRFEEDPLADLGIYLSVSSRETRALELVATHADL